MQILFFMEIDYQKSIVNIAKYMEYLEKIFTLLHDKNN